MKFIPRAQTRNVVAIPAVNPLKKLLECSVTPKLLSQSAGDDQM
jgi:hypothetical protein